MTSPPPSGDESPVVDPVMPTVDPEPEPTPPPEIEVVVVEEVVEEVAVVKDDPPPPIEETTVLVITTEDGEPIEAVSRAQTVAEIKEDTAEETKPPTQSPTTETIEEEVSKPWYADVVATFMPKSETVSRVPTIVEPEDETRAVTRAPTMLEIVEEPPPATRASTVASLLEEPRPISRTITRASTLPMSRTTTSGDLEEDEKPKRSQSVSFAEKLVTYSRAPTAREEDEEIDPLSRATTGKRLSIADVPELREEIESLIVDKVHEMSRVHTAVSESAAELPIITRPTTTPPPPTPIEEKPPLPDRPTQYIPSTPRPRRRFCWC